jgi:hypothetical protein
VRSRKLCSSSTSASSRSSSAVAASIAGSTPARGPFIDPKSDAGIAPVRVIEADVRDQILVSRRLLCDRVARGRSARRVCARPRKWRAQGSLLIGREAATAVRPRRLSRTFNHHDRCVSLGGNSHVRDRRASLRDSVVHPPRYDRVADDLRARPWWNQVAPRSCSPLSHHDYHVGR